MYLILHVNKVYMKVSSVVAWKKRLMIYFMDFHLTKYAELKALSKTNKQKT